MTKNHNKSQKNKELTITQLKLIHGGNGFDFNWINFQSRRIKR